MSFRPRVAIAGRCQIVERNKSWILRFAKIQDGSCGLQKNKNVSSRTLLLVISQVQRFRTVTKVACCFFGYEAVFFSNCNI